MHRLGFNKSQIERKVGVNRDTVRKYLEKDSEKVTEWMYTLQNHTKKLDSYADIIPEWLEEHSDLSVAQIEKIVRIPKQKEILYALLVM